MKLFSDVQIFGETNYSSNITQANMGFVNYFDGISNHNIETYGPVACQFIGGTYDNNNYPKCNHNGIWKDNAEICVAVGGVMDNGQCKNQSPQVAEYYGWSDRTNYNTQGGQVYQNFDPSTKGICYYTYYSKQSGKTQTCTQSSVQNFSVSDCQLNGGNWQNVNGVDQCTCGGSVNDDIDAGNGKITSPTYLQLDIDNGSNPSTCYYNPTNAFTCASNGSPYFWDFGTSYCNGNGVGHNSRNAGECCTSSDKCAGVCNSTTGKCVDIYYSVDGDTKVENRKIYPN
jgi:hypothetical protein